jgi:hypothetical protein
MYTDKTVAQAMKAINERLHAPGTKSRPQMDGYVEKNGRFAMAVTTRVFGRFRRKTFLRGQAERDSGATIIRGNVPGGLSRNRQIVVVIMLAVVALVIFAQGNAILAIVVGLSGAALTIPFQGDFDNSELLLTELQRALQAKFTPPKK